MHEHPAWHWPAEITVAAAGWKQYFSTTAAALVMLSLPQETAEQRV
jgi:hypothetical protein